MFKKWIRRLFYLGFSSILLTTLSICFFLYSPQTLINSSNLKKIARFATLYGTLVDWSSLDLRLEKLGHFRHKLILHTQDLSIFIEDGTFFANIPKFSASIDFGLDRSGVKIFSVNPLSLQAKSLRFKSIPEPTPSKSTSPAIPSWLRPIQVGDLDIHIRSLEILGQNIHYKANINLKSSLSQLQKRILKLNGYLIDKITSKLTLVSKIEIKTQTFEWIHLIEGTLPVEFQSDAHFRSPMTLISLHSIGQISPSGIKVSNSGNLFFKNSPFHPLTLSKCNLELAKTSRIPLPFQLTLGCPVHLGLKSDLTHASVMRGIPSELNPVIQADLGISSFPIDENSKIEGKIELSLPPVKSHFIKGDGHFTLYTSGKLANFPHKLNLEAESLLHIKISSFENLVKEFENASFAIPAPFQSLQGNIETEIKGQGNLANFEFPYHLKTHLKSPAQRILLEGNGVLKWKDGKLGAKLSTEADLTLSDVQLIFPKIDLTSLPRILPDERIRITPKKPPPPKNSFEYSIRLRSGAQPIQLLTHWTQQAVPLKIDLKISNSSPIEGVIEAVPFSIDFFKRKSKLKKFTLVLASPAKESKINGLVTVEYADYKINIEVAETLEHPRIKFLSEPYLSENQAIATLFFGHPLEELDADQAASVGSTREAIANRAMDLAFLYLLASTPIERVNYDPVNKMISAKLKIAKGTSLTVGTDTSDLRVVGLRRRIGKRWAIQTELINPTDRQNRSLSTFLEWGHRY